MREICIKSIPGMNDQYGVAGRLLRYVQVDTQSDPASNSSPSTEKQKDLSRMLVRELHDIGITDAAMDDYGYVYATVSSNLSHDTPVICFCAHVDTAPDCSGTGVKPILHARWDGSPIALPDDPSQVITVEDHPYLKERIGDDIITASGTTLLGADDKAGVAVIMSAAAYWMENPSVPRGKIRILFTPDEEIGRGVDKLDVDRLGAQYAYTLDGSERGSLEDETFSADGATVRFFGIIAHPGSAKGKMVNAIKVAAAFVDALPKDRLTPESTEYRQGFVHPVSISGGAESASVDLILRDFDTKRLKEYRQLLEGIAADIIHKFPGARYEVTSREQYRNMKEVLDLHPQVVAYAADAIRTAGMEPRMTPIRGGTDGSRMSFMGLPCPNIFTGEMALHSRQEYVSVQDMEKSVETVIEIAKRWAAGGSTDQA